MTKENQTYIGYVWMNNETILEVGKFAILWNVFEEWRCKCNCSHEKIKEVVDDVMRIRAIVGKRGEEDAFINFAAELADRAKKTSGSVESYVKTKLYPDDERARITKKERDGFMATVINFINSGGKNALDGALLAIWRIRNNMFHGLKGHSVLDEQIELFRAMNAVLEEAK
jgi:hypothetical protein